MNFLFPAGLIFGALIPVIVALYLRRPKRRERTVASLLFWERVLDRQPKRRFFGSLRNWLSLLLQILIFLLLLAALVRPEFGGPKRTSTVVVLDARARMQAHGGAVFDDATAAARLAATPGPGRETAVVAAHPNPEVVVPFTTDPKLFRELLGALKPSDGGGDFEAAVSLGRHLAATRPGNPRLVVITDRESGPDRTLTGRAGSNVALTEFSARPIPASPQTEEVLARIVNFSNETRNIEWSLTLDDRLLAVRKLTLAPGEGQQVTENLPAARTPESRGWLTSTITPTDDLPVDNTARAALPRGQALRVLLVSAGNPYLESALAADGRIARELLTPDQWRSGLGGGFDAVIFDNVVPGSLDELGDGNMFFFGRSPFDTSQTGLPVAETASLSSHPLLWNVDVDTTRFAQRRPVKWPENWGSTPVITGDGEPLVTALELPDGRRVVVAGFSAVESDLPFRAAFPLFVSNTIHWLGHRETSASSALRAGSLAIPLAGESLALDPETKEAWTDKPTTLRANGFYEVRKDDASRWIAVNTSDAAESDLRAAFGGGALPGAILKFQSLPAWQWCALLAAALITAEWLLHHRRITE